MAPQPPFLYRGTTVGWPGNEVLQKLGLTPTTEDPVVATLFGLWNARYGEAILLVCEFNAVADLIGPSNWKSRIECEVVISVPPAVFTERLAVATIPAQMARETLAEMGYELARVFMNHDDFLLRLKNTPRLDDRETARFDQLMLRRG
jgi:hypothetical protein